MSARRVRARPGWPWTRARAGWPIPMPTAWCRGTGCRRSLPAAPRRFAEPCAWPTGPCATGACTPVTTININRATGTATCMAPISAWRRVPIAASAGLPPIRVARMCRWSAGCSGCTPASPGLRVRALLPVLGTRSVVRVGVPRILISLRCEWGGDLVLFRVGLVCCLLVGLRPATAQNKETGHEGRLHCCLRWRAESTERVDRGIQATLVASGLVLVDQVARGITIHQGDGGLVGGRGGGLVAGLDRLGDLLQRGAHHGTGAGVALAVHFRLARALLRGLDVGQGMTPNALS